MYTDLQEKEYKRILDVIFDRKYEVRIKKIDNMSVEELEFYGMYSTGDRELDNELSNELIVRWLSINEMVEYFKRGKPFRITNVKDTDEIYDFIHQYLLSWKNRLENSVNIGNAPIEDLIALDAMAGSVHGYACEHMKVQKTQSSLMNYFNSMGLGRRADVVPVTPQNDGVRRHESLAEIFSEAIMGHRGR